MAFMGWMDIRVVGRDWASDRYAQTSLARVHSVSERVQKIPETSKTTKNHFFGWRPLVTERGSVSVDSSTSSAGASARLGTIVQHWEGSRSLPTVVERQL